MISRESNAILGYPFIFTYSVNYALYGTTAANPGKGVLTVNIDGTWGTVCGRGSPYFGMEEAHAACRGLGYHHAISEEYVYHDDSYNCRKSCGR